jgi:chorismate mutase/prephenate dehydratase
VQLRIHHHVMGRLEDFKDARIVYSHQQSLAQCRNWLDSYMPHAERIAVSSNAEAAKLVKDDDSNAIAIAGEIAAGLYGLNILVSNIEDEPDNTTRFLIIGKNMVSPSGNDKTALLMAAHNRPGALSGLLEPLARNNISMTRIESRPSRKGMWDYVFFVDIEGHAEDDNVAKALEELREEASMVKVLGSFPVGVL